MIEAGIGDWQPPPGVRVASSTRSGGSSVGPWASLNLAEHVDDDPAHVQANRERLARSLGLPSQPVWLKQVHGARVVELPLSAPEFGTEIGAEIEADAACTREPGAVCAVMTADCLPVLFADLDGSRVAAAHAGWRGLAGGVLEATLERFADPSRVQAWLGPAIGPRAFQVGPEVREAFVSRDARAAAAFVPDGDSRWLADIYRLARLRLAAAGLEQLYGGGHCTFTEEERYFSYRRDGITGRMAHLIWIEEDGRDER